MNRMIIVAALAALAMPMASAAWAAGATELELLGKDPGTAEAYSCFSRHYDDAHLATHPHQNVRDVKIFVDSTAQDGGDRQYSMAIGLQFRKLKREFDIDGGCLVDGKLLDCGADCDGGHFGITTQGSSGVLLSIPDQIHIWDPEDEPNSDKPLPKAAVLGSDDKAFKLDRVDTRACRSLMNDETIAAIFGATKGNQHP